MFNQFMFNAIKRVVARKFCGVFNQSLASLYAMPITERKAKYQNNREAILSDFAPDWSANAHFDEYVSFFSDPKEMTNFLEDEFVKFANRFGFTDNSDLEVEF